VREYSIAGWPERNKLPSALQPYWPYRGNFTVLHGLLVYDERIVIPSQMRLEILDRIHDGHQGITKCRERAKSAVWWPGLSRQIYDMISNCRKCIEHRSNPREPLIPTAVPDRPWQTVGTDLLYLKGKPYLVAVDYFSKFVEVSLLASETSQETIRALKSIFARHGIPETLRSDNGPQYSSGEFAKFAKEWEFQHVTSSPIYPQSNGGAERAVQTVKNLLSKSADPHQALLAYRSTSLEVGKSPAELLFGRKLRNGVPVMPTSLEPNWPGFEKVKDDARQQKLRQKEDYDSRFRVRELPPLQIGQKVWVPDRKESATVTRLADTPRSYVVESETGQVRRNRRSLLPCGKDETTERATSEPSAPYRTRSGRTVVPPDRLNT